MSDRLKLKNGYTDKFYINQKVFCNLKMNEIYKNYSIKGDAINWLYVKCEGLLCEQWSHYH